jgi:hypothetical protein
MDRQAERGRRSGVTRTQLPGRCRRSSDGGPSDVSVHESSNGWCSSRDGNAGQVIGDLWVAVIARASIGTAFHRGATRPARHGRADARGLSATRRDLRSGCLCGAEAITGCRMVKKLTRRDSNIAVSRRVVLCRLRARHQFAAGLALGTEARVSFPDVSVQHDK